MQKLPSLAIASTQKATRMRLIRIDAIWRERGKNDAGHCTMDWDYFVGHRADWRLLDADECFACADGPKISASACPAFLLGHAWRFKRQKQPAPKLGGSLPMAPLTGLPPDELPGPAFLHRGAARTRRLFAPPKPG
jgi:hypothetical protein